MLALARASRACTARTLLAPQRARHLSARPTFPEAQARAKALPAEPSNEDKLRLYALFKQATAGANTTPKPSMLDFVGGAKWAAWSRLGAMPPPAAEAAYIELVQQLGGGALRGQQQRPQRHHPTPPCPRPRARGSPTSSARPWTLRGALRACSSMRPP